MLDTLGQPVGLYWGLWYGTNLSHNLGMFWVGYIGYTSEKISQGAITDVLQYSPLSRLVWEVFPSLNTSIAYTTSSAKTRAPGH